MPARLGGLEKLNAFQQRCLRKILKITFRGPHYLSTEIRPVVKLITERRMEYTWHVLRMPPERLPRTAISWQQWEKGKEVRPKDDLYVSYRNDLEAVGIDASKAKNVAQDRK